ncbi:hypothetical protein [Nitrosomonas eutropha]|uniref:Uncharacterized protein n=2 Tax=Nitrosomonas eutropha TaxID=916 RepID=A0ABX5MA54_9PROT|nr:hypothetical protein [Nitrosomonas eutropha]ABI58366.1 hypothetical protein Neut_0078 [Nitrosomonas eutropha C91]PXV84191.1 hypothetical protein C8R14_10172 [Nitrosomonas eutropha]
MQPKTHHIEGVAFIATPYRAGTYLRKDVFWRQFTITCQGNVEYLEDDPVYGSWWTPHTLILGNCGLIQDAMSLANTRVSQHDFDLTDAIDALNFAPELIVIRDRDGRLVLAGQVRGDNVRWCIPVASDEETEQIVKEVAELRSEASYEAGWDNFSTAQGLRFRARVLEGRLVDRFWRFHTRKVVLEATL